MKTALLTSASTEAVTLSSIKKQLRLSTNATNDDALLTAHRVTARKTAEAITNRRFIHESNYLYLDDWPAGDSIEMPFAPLVSAPSTAIVYKKSDGNSTTLSSSAWEVDAVSRPGRIVLGYGESWPGDTLWPTNPIRIEFKCGYGATTDSVPGHIRLAIRLLTGHYFENRENSIVMNSGGTVEEIPGAAKSLLSQSDKDYCF